MQNKLCKPQICLNINNKHLHFPFWLVISSDVLVSHKQQWKRGQFYVFMVLSMSFIHSVFNTRQLFIDNMGWVYRVKFQLLECEQLTVLRIWAE